MAPTLPVRAMTTTATPVLSLEAFLAQPETQPASEFWDGQIPQKPRFIAGKTPPNHQSRDRTRTHGVGFPRIALYFRREGDRPPVLTELNLELTVDEIWGWLCL